MVCKPDISVLEGGFTKYLTRTRLVTIRFVFEKVNLTSTRRTISEDNLLVEEESEKVFQTSEY